MADVTSWLNHYVSQTTTTANKLLVEEEELTWRLSRLNPPACLFFFVCVFNLLFLCLCLAFRIWLCTLDWSPRRERRRWPLIISSWSGLSFVRTSRPDGRGRTRASPKTGIRQPSARTSPEPPLLSSKRFSSEKKRKCGLLKPNYKSFKSQHVITSTKMV